MISGLLKEYKTIYNKYLELGKAYPITDMAKQDKNNYFDSKLWQHLAKNGMHGLIAEKKYGGNAFSAIETCVAYEALACGCENNGMVFSSIAHLFACVAPLSLYGSDAQKARYLKKMTTGQWIAANAITEQNSGSDVFKMTSSAVKDGNKYLLNGEKKYVTNAPIANVFILFVSTDKAKGFFGGISCFIINTDSKNIKKSKPIDKMGLRTAQMGDLNFKNLLIDEANMIGKPGAGGQIFNASMIWERVIVSAFLTGQLERVIEKTITFVKSREIGDKKLASLQYVQHKIADAKTILQASKNMVYDAAFAIDNKHKNAFTKASMTKLFVSDQVVNTIKQLQELYGANGYLSNTGIEREYRDASAALIYSGTSAIQRNIISSDILR